MKWKDKILKQKEQGRIPEEYFGLIVSTVEQGIQERELEIVSKIGNLIIDLNKQRDSISSENLISFNTRIETLEEILHLI